MNCLTDPYCFSTPEGMVIVVIVGFLALWDYLDNR